MDRAKSRLSFISVLIAALLVAFLGMLALVGLGNVADTAQADPLPHVHDDVTFESWSSATSLPDTAGNWYLTEDVTLTSTWNVPSGTTNLCLNGCTITKTGDTGSVFHLSGNAVLNIYDGDQTTHYYYINDDYVGVVVDTLEAARAGNPDRNGSFVGGYITGGKGYWSDNDYRGGCVLVEGTATINLYGGTLIGNAAVANCGGVYLRQSGVITLHEGAAIIGNCSHGEGGAILLHNDSQLIMDGGLIAHNTATGNSGAIAVNSTATITGGKITGNISLGKNDAGAIGAGSPAASLLIGGNVEISGNYAGGNGGGVYNIGWGWKSGGTSLSGSPVIRDNYAKHGGDTYVPDNFYISTINNGYYEAKQEILFSGALTDKALIGLTLQDGVGVAIFGVSEYATATNFTCDGDEFGVSIVNGDLVINYRPIVYEGITFEPWIETDRLPDEAGSYYLTADVTISSTWTVPSGTTNLCLNGKGIKMTGGNSVVTINAGAILKLYDCDTTTEHRYSLSNAKSNGAGFATVNDSLTSGYLTFKGGYITGGRGRPINTWNRGGALYIEGAVEMYGGTLIGNGQYGTTHGGAFNTQGTGSFKMYGGSIQNNAGLCGGATRLQSSGSCEILGGKIINNIVTNDGGAIHVGGEISVILQDCEISGNYAGNGPGAGIWMTTTGTVISGRTIITNNLTDSGASNVEIDNGYVIGVGELTDGATIGIKLQSGTGTFTSGWSTYMQGKNPADYFTSDNGDYEISLSDGEAKVAPHEHDDVTFSAWTKTDSLPTSGNYYLTADVTVSSTTTVSGALNLCLNGHGVIAVTSDDNKFSVITVNNDATFNLYDGGTARVHRFTVIDPAANGAGLATVNNALESGYQTFIGGYITGGYGAPYGGGVNVQLNGRFNMYGGTIIGNKATSHGGGVCTSGSGNPASVVDNFVMYGGTICYNQANWGGAIAIYGNVYIHNEADVSYNVATSGGGGIELESKGTLYMDGGLVHDNVILSQNANMWKGGGVHVPSGSECHFNGSVQIVNNYQADEPGSKNNVFVRTGLFLTIDAELAQNASVGVTMQSGSGVFTSGWSTYMKGRNLADYFTSDDSAYGVLLEGEELALRMKVSADIQGYEGTYDGQAHGISVTPSVEGAAIKYGTSEDDCSPEALTYTDVGTYTVYYVVTKSGYVSAKGSATVTITPLAVNVTITGKSTSNVYDGKEYTISGYDVEIDKELYQQSYFTFSGKAEAKRTVAGKSPMGLAAEKFANTNDNFSVTFTVTDGYYEITPRPLTITADALSKAYGDDDPALTYTADGVVGQDAFVGALERAAGEDLGTYEITIGTLSAGDNYDVTFIPAELTIEQKIEVIVSEEETQLDVTVQGLDKETEAIRAAEPTAREISVVMTVKPIAEPEIAEDTQDETHVQSIQSSATEKNFAFYKITVEKRVDGDTTFLKETSNVIEIAIPYTKAHKRGLTVYSYHGDEVVTFVESDNKEAGTFRVDKENKIIYVYANSFSTYAIGYTPYYRVATAVDLGTYTGNADVVLINRTDGTTYEEKDVDPANIVFADVPKGQYLLTVTWTDGAKNTLTIPLAVGSADPIPFVEPTEEEAEPEAPAAAESAPIDDPFEETADDLEDVVLEDRRYARDIFALTKRDNDRDDA